VTPHLTGSRIRELLDRHGIEPSRALGQNFVTDPNTAARIVRLAGVRPGDPVVEIGPGVGSLSVALVDAGARLVAVEVDRYLVPVLEEVLAGSNARIVLGDARELDWASVLADAPRWKVVANLPYNIATPLVLDLLDHRPELTDYLVMVQREVGERLAAGPGSKTYGIPSVKVAYWGSARVVGRVSAEVFHPRPRVDSVLVRIERQPSPRVDADPVIFFDLVRAGFGQRRKMLRRSLGGRAGPDAFERAGVAPTARAEDLGIEDWARLARAVAAEAAG
jgi:16S rRNA (adenine1518-N6/adenine1519-N6)-dimethyltransferase